MGYDLRITGVAMVVFEWGKITQDATSIVKQQQQIKLDRHFLKSIGLGSLSEEQQELVYRYLINARGKNTYQVVIKATGLNHYLVSGRFGVGETRRPDIYLVGQYQADEGVRQITISNGMDLEVKKGDILNIVSKYQLSYLGMLVKRRPYKLKTILEVALLVMFVLLVGIFKLNIIAGALVYVGGVFLLRTEYDRELNTIQGDIIQTLGTQERYTSQVVFHYVKDWIGYQRTEELIYQYQQEGAWKDEE